MSSFIKHSNTPTLSSNTSPKLNSISSNLPPPSKLSNLTTSLENFLATFHSTPSNNQSNNNNNNQSSSTHTHSIHPPTSNPINLNLSSKNQTVRNAWQYLPFLTKQATNIASSFVSHHFKGPPKKSWGIEMTIFTAIVRDMANFTHLSSVHQLRSLMDLGQILPMPKDGIITPVSFKVKRHNLTGFLQELDRSEDGTRVLTGEWVLSKKTWKRMQTESLARRSKNQDHRQDYSFASPPKPQNRPDSSDQHGLGRDKVIYFIHGGAYFIMSASTHRPLTISIAKFTECRLFAINYRLAPETKFPGPLHDVVAGYFRLLNDLSIPPQNIVLAGDSAGGGLVMALLMYLRDEKYPLPSAAMVFSPWCDLTMSCESWITNQPYDFLPMPKPDDPLNPVRCYLGEDGVSKWITHPYVSPLFGDMHGLPPLLIQAGDAEVLRDEITLLAHKASLHGVTVMHEIYEDCVHVFQAFLFLESSTKALQSMRNFIRHVLPKMEGQLDQTSEAETCYRPPPFSPGSDDQQSIDTSDPSQGAVDREISRDAHLVDEMSQTATKSLPPTPLVPNLDGSEDQETSDSEEILSASDDPEDDDNTLTLPLEQAGSSSTTKSSNPSGLVPQTSEAPSSNLKPPSATMNSARQENRSPTLSLRGLLPPAMDLETIKNLLLSTSLHDPSSDHLRDKASPTNLKEDIALKSPQSNLNSPRQTSLLLSQPNSGSQSPVGSRHTRRNSAYSNSVRQGHVRKFTTSNVALLTPMVRTQDNRGVTSSNVNEDVQAMVQDLISTPSLLRTTVYSQGEEEDPDIEYFRGIHSFSRRSANASASETTPPVDAHHVLNSSNAASSRHNETRDSISPSTSETYLHHTSLDDGKLDHGRDSPDFAFQTPGYGFS